MSDPVASTPRSFVLAWAATLAALVGATWPLWTPSRSPPRLPPLEPLNALPKGLDWFAIVGVGVGLLMTVTDSSRWRTRGLGLTLLALTCLLAGDQLRWQPWAWHALLAGAILVGSAPREATILLRLIAVAVYAYSGFAKLDYEFAATLGQQFLRAASTNLGVPLETLAEPTRIALAMAAPCVELSLACLLLGACLWRSWRRAAVIAAVVFHGGTIVALSPIGLGHSLGVLLWNVGFGAQTAILFWPTASEEERPASHWGRVRRIAWAAAALAIIAPALTPLGLWDRWPGWALYAPGGERATLLVHDAAVERLPESLREHVGESESPWRPVALDSWMLAETGAPIYPQNRVVRDMTRWLASRYPLAGGVRVVEETAADRWSRERKERLIETDADRG